MTTGKLMFWFEEIGKEHNDIVGKKCANLGEMTRMGLAVPPGFALSLDVYRLFVKESGLGEEMERYVQKFGDLKGQGIAVFDEMSQTLRGMVEAREIPEHLKAQIVGYYQELSRRLGVDSPAVSVRSAGTESRPGMFETYLNVKGQDDLLEKVKKVWASAYTPRAIAFRANKGFPILGDELGVAIPKMVNARASGIAFTVNPVDGDASKIILEANWGLGEGVVSGAECVDGFIVNRQDFVILKRNVGNKTRCVMNVGTGADWVDVPDSMRCMPCMDDQEVVEVSKLAVTLEEKLGCPQDVEWAIDQDLPFPRNIFHLQTRPAKVQAKKPVSTTDRILELMAKRYHRG
ncbi:MAG: PEP/pyruvate-binding domain-containing protein [Thermodesulfobacteriota bacterium]